MRGLEISRDEFKTLPRSQKDLVIFDNLQFIRTKIRDSAITTKIQWAWLTGLTGAAAWFIKTVLSTKGGS